MAVIVTRSGKGAPLENAEVDANFTNLNTDKLEKDGSNLASKVSFDTTAALTPTTGQLVWDAETGTVDIGLNGATAPVMSVGEDQFYRVINQTGSTITKGTLVMAFGTVGASGKIKVKAWDGTQPSKTIMGLVMADIPTENDPTESGLGYVMAFGKITGIQTNGANYGETWVDGDIIYAGASSGLTKTLPAAPNTKTTVAIVINSHASNGTLFVRPTYGSSLAEDELVQLASLANGDVLSYDSTDGRFENKTLAAAGIYATSNPAGYTTNTGTVTSVGGTGTVNGLTLTGTVTSSGNLTLGGTLSGVNLTSQVTGILPVANGGSGATTLTGVLKGNGTSAFTAGMVALGSEVSGTLPVANGGTGQTTYTNGQLLIGNTTGNTLTKATLTAGTGISITNGTGSISIAATNNGTVTSVGGTGTVNGITLTGTVTSSGNLTLGGTLSGVSLTTQVTGTLPVANGGTGATSLTANNVILGNGTSAVQVVAPGTSGNVLTSNGSTWTSAAAGAALSGVTDSASPFETALGSGAGAVNTGSNNTFIGYEAGNDNTTGQGNTAVGFRALDVNVTGGSNVAVGANALGAHTTNSATAVGNNALAASTTGGGQAFGNSALLNTTTGSGNNAFGQEALRTNTTGGANCAFGDSALRSNTTSNNNTAIGDSSLFSNTTGTRNTAVGAGAMVGNTTGTDNTAVGYYALDANTTGTNNVAMGHTALGANTTGANNTAVGFESGDKITTGTQNVILGTGAASSGTNDLTTGSNNIIIGYNAAASSASVSNEVTIGNTSITSTRLRGMVELNAAMFEKATISATAATGTINFDARTQSVLYYTSNASGNWTLNIRAASGVSLDSVMTTGSSITLAFMVTNGATAYYQTAFQVDGSSVTPKWQGGAAPTAGNASSIDAYVITVIKTGTATFTALASQTAFA